MSSSNFHDWVGDPAFPHTLSGDFHDDDAQYVNDLVSESQAPADGTHTGTVVPILDKMPRYGRLLSGYQQFNGNNLGLAPIMALPADENRKALHLRFDSDDTNDYILYADSPLKLAPGYAQSGLAFRLKQGVNHCIDDYTGALWYKPIGGLNANNILAPSAAQPTSLTGWSKQAGDTQALIAAPWDATRQAYQITAAGGATSYAICPPSVSQVQAGQTVWVRAKINASAVYSFTLRLYSSGGLSLGTVATISTLSGNNLEYGGSIVSNYTGFVRVAFVSTTNTTLGDTIAIGDCQISPAGMPLKYFDANTASDATYQIVANADGSASGYGIQNGSFSWTAVTK